VERRKAIDNPKSVNEQCGGVEAMKEKIISATKSFLQNTLICQNY